jgi:hypothetical protein
VKLKVLRLSKGASGIKVRSIDELGKLPFLAGNRDVGSETTYQEVLRDIVTS